MIKIVKEVSPNKKVEIKDMKVKEYPKTKEYDMTVEEQPLIPDVNIKTI